MLLLLLTPIINTFRSVGMSVGMSMDLLTPQIPPVPTPVPTPPSVSAYSAFRQLDRTGSQKNNFFHACASSADGDSIRLSAFRALPPPPTQNTCNYPRLTERCEQTRSREVSVNSSVSRYLNSFP